MTINKIQNSNKLTNYVTNHSGKIFDDKRLSYGAKGVFLQAIYLFSTNQFSLNALFNHINNDYDSKNKIKGYLRELINYDYIKLHVANNKIFFKIVY